MGNRQSSNSLWVEQETTVLNERSSRIAGESDVSDEEHEHGQLANMQPQKRQRTVYEQSMVIREQEQGSSSISQLTSQLVTLYNNSALHQNIVILTEKLNHLFAQRHDVLTELENAEIQPGKKRREVVQHWLTEVQRKEHKIQAMIEDGQGSTSNSNLSLSIESFITEIDELIQRSNFPNGLVVLDQESTRLPLLLDIKPVGISFQKNAEKIMGWLQNHEHHIIGVYGMGGVGKTTLLTHMHDQLLQDSNLSLNGHVYWVTVSQNCTIRELQDDIAKVLGLASFPEDDEKKRAAVLHNRLVRGRTVLILDDMWEQVSGSKVGIPLGNSNCKIILSTRVYDVCRKMGCKDFVIKAETLLEDEAWNLFVEKLGHYDTLEEEAKKIAWDIAKECGRLPLAIATMARSMTDVVDINEWKTALNDLKSARDQADMKEDVFQILQYSYDRLNDKRVQNCFLSCILYGEDVRIDRIILIDLWINEGLLDDIESRDAQVSKGHVILNKLESSCLLESTLGFAKGKCVKMHDLIRDMAVFITKEHPLFIAEARKQLKQVPEEEKWSKDLVKVSLSHNRIEEIPSGMAPVTPDLTVLMLNDNPLKELPDSFFVHMKALTVLDLSRTKIERVPESVSDLEKLRLLRLVGCYKLRYVPSVAKLTKLRTLDLHGCWELEEAPRGLERLRTVEKVSYIPWDVSDLIGFNKLIQSLTSSNFSKIFIRGVTSCKPSHDLVEFFERNDKGVWIEGGKFGEDESNCWLPTTLECLRVYECDLKGRSLDVVFPSLSEAPAMKEIDISFCKGLESISGSSGTRYRSSLLFTNLRELSIDSCPRLKVVLPMMCSNQLQLPNLVSIKVMNCEGVEEIFGSNKTIQSSPIRSLLLPNLEMLNLQSLPKTKVIFPFTEELHLPNLKYIRVEDCEEMEEIFGSHKAILSLPNLKDLTLRRLPKIKVVFKSADQLQLPSLSKIEVKECEKVEEIFETNKASLPLPTFSLPNLKELFLSFLPKMKVMFPFTQQLNLPELDTIVVKNCDEVEEMFESNKATTLPYPILCLPNLRHLYFEHVQKIKVIFPFTQQLDLPKLEGIEVRNCKGVEEIFESNKAFPSNPILWLPNWTNSRFKDLPELRSLYRGLLLCTFLYDPTPYIDNCPKLKLWSFPGVLTSVEPCSTVRPKQETVLLTEIDINQPASLPHSGGNSDDDNWGASLSLFPC